MLDRLAPAMRRQIRKREQPRWTPPMLATLTEKPFSDAAWVFERKYDGVRCIANHCSGPTGLRLLSRNEKSLNRTFPELHAALQDQPTDNFIVDGEIVAFDGPVTSFGLLQRRLGISDPRRARSRNVPVYLYLFDLLYVDGYDITALPLLERKRMLKRAIDFRSSHGVIRYSSHRREHGERYLREACDKGWEGLIAKQAHSPYQPRRSRHWLKFKCVLIQEFVIGGFTDPQRSRVGFGALLVGYYDRDHRLHYAGKVGTGFDDETLRILGRHMRSSERRSTPFAERNLDVRDAHWIDPHLVAQVGFTEWTGDGRLRHPRFLGLRMDKPPNTVVRERPIR